MSETAVATQERAPTFNLLDDPWIPVRRPDGRLDEVGLLTLFRQSRDIEGLAETSPPSLVALHRLLLAVTHRALTNGVGRWVTDDRVRWYNEGLPITALVNYLEQWRERFWLFHPTHPFMQVAALAGPLPAKALKRFDSAFAAAAPPARWLEAKPWMQIALESVSGNNPVVFDHSTDEAPQPISAGLALRHLLAYLQYAPGQPVKGLCNTGNDLSGPIFNSASVIPLASTLHRSLMLGLAPPVFDMSHDLPSWERDQLTVENLLSPAVLATGVCDRFTRQTRAVLLLREESGLVSRLYFAEGRALLDDPNSPDPMSSYRPGAEAWVRLTFSEGRATWRDLSSLLPDASGKLARPASILNGAINVHHAAGRQDEAIELLVAGLAAKQGKMLRARVERFRFPPGVLVSADAAAETRNQLRRAEELFASLRMLCVKLVAKTMPDPESKDTRERARGIVAAGATSATFFSAAERDLPNLLRGIGQGDIEGAHFRWSATLLRAARAAWQATSDALGESASALRAGAQMYERFQLLIRSVQPAAIASPSPTDTETTA